MRSVSLSLKKARHCQLQQTREFWPLIIAASTGAIIAHYAFRVLNRDENGQSSSDLADGAALDLQNSYGIDIGSTFSRVAMKKDGEKTPFLMENREGKRSTSSVVQFPHGINVADDSYTGTDDDRFIVGTSANFARFIKSDTTYSGSSMFSKSPSHAAALGAVQKSFIYYLLAKDLKVSALAKSDRASVLPAFCSVPNHFTAAQSSLLVSACRDAGFNCIASLPDGVSAVLGAIETGLYTTPLTNHDTVFVVDVGGGIVQLSLLLVKSAPNSVPIILSQKTLLNSGGNYFDEAVVAHLTSEFNRLNSGINISNDKMATQRLHDAAEAAKIELSSAPHSKILIPFLTANHTGPKHLSYDMSRAQLGIILEQQFKEINSSFMEVLNDGRDKFACNSDNIDDKIFRDNISTGGKLDLNLSAVILVGGGARMSLLKTSIQEVIGDVPLLVSPQPEETVAIGASVFSKLAKF